MIKTKLRWRNVNKMQRAVIRVEKKVDNTTDDFLKFCAEWLKNDIRSHWSSRPQVAGSGQPPAIKTANLDSSIEIGRRGRDSAGRFAVGGKAKTWYLSVDTTKGRNNDGRGHYEGVLESKAGYNLPFIQPAINRLSKLYETFGKRFIKTK